jgi:hypothetical protein
LLAPGDRPASKLAVAAWNRAVSPYGLATSTAPSRLATIIQRRVPCSAGEEQGVFGPALRENGLQPALVVIEEPDHLVAHRVGERLVLRGQHAAQAHSPAAQYLQVLAGVSG